VVPKIVLAIEPASAERVAWAGGELAAALGASVVLAHARNDPPLFNSVRERERARHRAMRRGRVVLRRARRALPGGVEAEERVELGAAATRLSEIANETSAALIVAGCRGRGPLASALLGSVSQALAQRAPCPVMIVTETASGGTPGRFDEAPGECSAIVAALDSSSQSCKVARFARELADRIGERLLIVPTHAVADPPAVTIKATVDREQARLIVIAAHHADDDRFMPPGSLATRLPGLTGRPVIVIPDEATATLDETGQTVARQAA
jgi:nucleotide-binding universal stress UspA family protein